MENEQHQQEDFTGKRLVYDYYFHESDRISTRTDWFLVFHAILLEAFFSIHPPDAKKTIVIGSVGVLCAYIWWVNGLRAYRISWQLGEMLSNEQIMGDLAKMNDRIFEERKSGMDRRWYGWAKHVPLYTVVTPFLFILTWEILLFFSITGNCSRIGAIWLLCCLVAGTLASMWLISTVTKKVDRAFSPTSKSSPSQQ